MVYYKNVIVKTLCIFIVFVLKIISLFKISVMALLLLMVMNNCIIKLPLPPSLFFTPELCPFVGFLPGPEVSGCVLGSSTESSVGSGVAVSFLLVLDAVMV